MSLPLYCGHIYICLFIHCPCEFTRANKVHTTMFVYKLCGKPIALFFLRWISMRWTNFSSQIFASNCHYESHSLCILSAQYILNFILLFKFDGIHAYYDQGTNRFSWRNLHSSCAPSIIYILTNICLVSVHAIYIRICIWCNVTLRTLTTSVTLLMEREFGEWQRSHNNSIAFHWLYFNVS